MSILQTRIPIKHKTFRELEIDFLNMVVGYHVNMYQAFFYDFETEVLEKLGSSTRRPFEIIYDVGPNSNKFVDLIVSSGVSFHNRFIDILTYTISHFDEKLDNVSVNDLLTIPYITPFKARQFHWVARDYHDPIRMKTLLLTEYRLNKLKMDGVNITGNIRNPLVYNRLELTYLELFGRESEY